MLRKHEARNGSPAEYFADLGRQIIGADRVMAEAVADLDTGVISDAVARNNTKFNFGTPHFPAGQGAVERLIQEVKKGLKVLLNHDTMTFGELETFLAEASYLINCRPMQVSPTVGADGFICPNDVLFGRSDKAPPMDTDLDHNLTNRVSFIRRVLGDFWGKWSCSYKLSLVKYHRWRLRSRNAQPGDVVLMLDRESKGRFTLAEIYTVKEDADKIVRKVTLRYKLPKKTENAEDGSSNPFKFAERNVRNLALVVTREERDTEEPLDLDDLRNEVVDEPASVPNDSASESDVLEAEPEHERAHDQQDNVEDGLSEQDADEFEADEPGGEVADVQLDDVEDGLVERDADELEEEEPAPPLPDPRLLAPSSTGRVRRRPDRMNL